MDAHYRYARHALLALLLAALSACGGSEEDPAPEPEADYDVTLTGSVGDGPVLNANLTVLASDGEVLSTTISDQNAGYNIDLKTKGKYYPLTIDAQGGIDLATQLPPGFVLRSASTAPRNKAVANVNPFTTLAVSAAMQSNGGFSSNAIDSALATVLAEFNSGLTSGLSLDPMTTVIDDTNLAEIVKASEMLSEIFRRTQQQLAPARAGLSIDGVVDAIAADLVDGSLDGAGAKGADALVSAMVILVRSQVTLEAMTNELRVNGVVVTQTLDQIVQRLASGSSPALTGSRPVNTGMIEAATQGIESASALLPSAELDALLAALANVSPGVMAATADSLLPADPGNALDLSIAQLSAGDSADATTILTAQPTPTPTPTPTNTAPVISGTPPTKAVEGTSYAFVPTASDADGDALSFAIANRPSWAAFDVTTGALSGIPAAGDAGSYSGIVINVSDGTSSASLPAFSIDVAAATPPPPPTNTAPVISGTPPPSVTENAAYSFVPTASDADGDSLVFSISNRPGWATFDTATGALSGTPTTADIGSYGNIVVSVTDGTASASLNAFSITVLAAPLGSATLSWVPPTQNSDGSPLTDLAGYKVYWGTASKSYTNSVAIGNPGISTFVVDNLPAGTTYYFSVTAVSSTGVESTLSNEASKFVQ